MHSRLFSVASIVVVLLAVWLPFLASSVEASDAYQSVLQPVREAVRERTEKRISTYAMDVEVDPEAGTIAGTLRVTYVNTTGLPQEAVPFRLYPNGEYYGDAEIVIHRARVDGELVRPDLISRDTAMSVPLLAPLPPGDSVKIALRFTVSVPVDSSGTFGVFSRRSDSGTWILADWYPILAGWEEGVGYHVDAPTAMGDPTFSETGSYEVTVTIPEGWTPVASGTEQRLETVDGASRWLIQSGPVREFTMVLDDDFVASKRVSGGTLITVYTDGSGEGADGGELALEATADSLATYGELFGVYPYVELDLVETELLGALGVSWSGVIFLDSDQLLANPGYVYERPDRLRFTIAHEVGHQWWGSVVGVNSNDHTFLLEGLTNYLAVAAIERIDGPEEGRRQFVLNCVQPYVNVLTENGDGIADQPIDGEVPRFFATLIYGKAAIGFYAIRQEMGDDAFFAAIRAWADDFAFGISEPDDLLRAFESESSAEIGELWRFWFNSAETTIADVEALVN